MDDRDTRVESDTESEVESEMDSMSDCEQSKDETFTNFSILTILLVFKFSFK